MHTTSSPAIERQFPGFTQHVSGPAHDPAKDLVRDDRIPHTASAISTLVTAQMQFVALAPAGVLTIATASGANWSELVKVCACATVAAAVLSFYSGIRVLRAVTGLIGDARASLSSNEHIREWAKGQLDFTTYTIVLLAITVIMMMVGKVP
jgi:hypothetical protein